MFLTEQEARQKVCPFAGIRWLAEPNLAQIKENLLCEASCCMVWRTSKNANELAVDTLPIEKLSLSTRPQKALKSAKRFNGQPQEPIDTIGKLRALSKDEALERDNFGCRSWDETQRKLRMFLEGKTEVIKKGYCGLGGTIIA